VGDRRQPQGARSRAADFPAAYEGPRRGQPHRQHRLDQRGGTALAGPYSATKFASVGISEVLATELEGSAIGVSVLCPSWVKTRMLDNGRNRPARFGGPISLDADSRNAERNRRYAQELADGLDPADVAELVVKAIQARRLYIFTHGDRRESVAQRFEAMMTGFDAIDHGNNSCDLKQRSADHEFFG
jgi:NAD(P)-dependent dehydrogenase (short-subunit alcohol dehydrogenase family)